MKHPNSYDKVAGDVAILGRVLDPVGAGSIRLGVNAVAKVAGASDEEAQDVAATAEFVFNAMALFAGAQKGSANVRVPLRPIEAPSFLPPRPSAAQLAAPATAASPPATSPPKSTAPMPLTLDPTTVSGIRQVEAFQEAIRRVEQRIAADPNLAWSKLTLREQSVTSRVRFLQDAMYGKAFERLLWEELQPLGTFGNIANEKGFPQSRGDFADKPGVGYGLWYDVTTYTDVQRHQETRWYSPRTVFGGYNK